MTLPLDKPKRWRPWQISLRTLILLTFAAACAAWWSTKRGTNQREQELALQSLSESGAIAYNETDYDDVGYTIVFDGSPSDADLKQLHAIGDLKELWFGSQSKPAGPTDEQLSVLRRLSQLRALSLNNTPVTASGLSHLRRLKDLRFLDVSYTAVSYEGLSQLLPHLPNLEWLYIDHCRNVTRDQQQILQELAPRGCRVIGP